MLDYLSFDENGIKKVCNKQLHPSMMMDITVRRVNRGQKFVIIEPKQETAVLLTQGSIIYEWNNRKERASRKDVFSEAPYCLHVCRETKIQITAEEDSELIIQSTKNETEFESRFYTPNDCKIEVMGESQWEGTAKREVLTIFDYKNAPYSNMVIGEVITKAGRWSSYVPHSHPQPEVYYYKFDHPQGFGGSFIGEKAYTVQDGSAAIIEGGLTHPQCAAPGYNMYYCWMIRHLDQNPWTSRDIDPKHAWLNEI